MSVAIIFCAESWRAKFTSETLRGFMFGLNVPFDIIWIFSSVIAMFAHVLEYFQLLRSGVHSWAGHPIALVGVHNIRVSVVQ